MTNQSFIYDSDETNSNVNNPFNVERTALIRAAGLTECVDVYMAVGKCIECENDVLWVPITKCGGTASLCPDNNVLVISVPGRYALGDPTLGPLALAGNVNITKEEGISASQLAGFSCGEPCEPVVSGLATSW